MKLSDFGDVLKIGKWGFSGVKVLLRTTGVHIPPKTFMLLHRPLLGLTSGAHVKVY
jgi:hypothetical protein